jgi:hypothetical protein
VNGRFPITKGRFYRDFYDSICEIPRRRCQKSQEFTVIRAWRHYGSRFAEFRRTGVSLPSAARERHER